MIRRGPLPTDLREQPNHTAYFANAGCLGRKRVDPADVSEELSVEHHQPLPAPPYPRLPPPHSQTVRIQQFRQLGWLWL